MASRFWVGGGSANTWAATGNTNWAATSGGANNQTVPGTTDIAVFDSNSGVSNSVIGANITVQGLECDGSTLGTGAYAGTLTHNGGVTLTINTGAANSLRFASGMTYTPATSIAVVTLTHTSGTANIKTYGKALGALNINSIGGTTQPLDALKVNAATSSILTVTAGILDFNGGAGGPFALTACKVDLSPNNTRSLILGGLVTLGGNVSGAAILWNVANTGTLTFTKNTANLEITGNNSANITVRFIGGGLTYNDITIDASANSQLFTFTDANTFAHLSIGAGNTLSFPNSGTITVNNAFTLTGTASSPIILAASGTFTPSPVISVPSGACSLTWGAIANITGSGGATFTGTNVVALGAVGWSISPPADATLTFNANSVSVLNNTLGTIGRGTVTTGATTTSVPTSALTVDGITASGVIANQFAGRAVTFDGDTATAGLQGATAAITANTASNTPTLTVAGLPATPASGDTFSIT